MPNALPLRSVDVRMTPRASVRLANQLAHRAALEPHVRALAASIVSDLDDVPGEGPRAIGHWIRENIQYTKEAVGREILQGPNHTLSTRTGDCDDLAILFAALCQSIGLRAGVVGLRHKRAKGFFHAVGWAHGQMYELSKDHTYGPASEPRPLLMTGVPDGVEGYTFDAGKNAWHTLNMKGAVSYGKAEEAYQQVDGALQSLGIDLGGMLEGDPYKRGARGRAVGRGLIAVGGTAVKAFRAAKENGIPATYAAIIAAAAAVGKAASLGIKAAIIRRRARDRGNEVNYLIDSIAELVSPPSAFASSTVETRLYEAIPILTGTKNRRGKGSRRIQVASMEDRAPKGGSRWSDGSSKTRRGVYDTFRRSGNGADKMQAVTAGHVNALVVLGGSLARLPLAKRRETLALLFLSTIGSAGLTDLPWLAASIPDPAPPTSGPPVPVIAGLGLLGLGAAIALS